MKRPLTPLPESLLPHHQRQVRCSHNITRQVIDDDPGHATNFCFVFFISIVNDLKCTESITMMWKSLFVWFCFRNINILCLKNPLFPEGHWMSVFIFRWVALGPMLHFCSAPTHLTLYTNNLSNVCIVIYIYTQKCNQLNKKQNVLPLDFHEFLYPLCRIIIKQHIPDIIV